DVTISNFAVANGAAGSGLANGSGTDTYTAKTVDALVNEINNNDDLEGKIRASNDNGKLRIENLSTQDLSVVGATATGLTGGTGTANTQTIGGNTVRAGLADQFNELRDQLDKFADDASFNGINLLRGDNLKLTFNETGTSSIDISTKDQKAVNSTELGISNIEAEDLDSDANIDTLLNGVKESLSTIRSQSSSFGSNLSVVQNRTDFTKSMVNTLQTGADKLVLADTNEEAANLLALQTRQQLSSTALSMASQADQAVLRLF
ncbi:flagellin, partial [Flaviflagellibacter deserti]